MEKMFEQWRIFGENNKKEQAARLALLTLAQVPTTL